METLSKAALGLQALALAYPAFLGVVLAVGAIAPFATGSLTADHVADAAAGAAILVGLVSGYYLLLRFFIRGRALTRTAKKWWFAATTVAAASAVIATLYWAANISTTHGGTYFMPVGAGFGVLGYGQLFLPSFVHLAAEVWCRAVQPGTPADRPASASLRQDGG